MKQTSDYSGLANRINWRVSDFCTAHGISRSSFYEEIKKGHLKVLKHGSRTLISDEEAKAWQARLVNGGQK